MEAADMAYQGLMAWEVEAERRREVIASDATQSRRIRQPKRPATVRRLDLAVRSLIVTLTPGR
jgi:hypothetical protein